MHEFIDLACEIVLLSITILDASLLEWFSTTTMDVLLDRNACLNKLLSAG
jgi:hypothetical protein